MTPVERAGTVALGRKVSLLRAGESEAPGALLLHGIPTNAELWRPMLERLDSGVRAIAPDLPGYGASEPPRNLSIGAYHRFITGVAKAEGLRDYVLAGHDLGGLYALTYALAHPGRLRALVLLNTTIYPDPWVALGLVPLLAPGFGEAYAWLAGRERYSRVVQRDLLSMYPALAADGDVPSARGRPAGQPLQYLTEPYLRTHAWLSLVRSLRGLNPVRVLLWKRRMPRLDLPVLILWGEGDPYFPVSVPERLRRDLPRAELEYVPDGGHFLMLAQPGRVAGSIRRFMEEA